MFQGPVTEKQSIRPATANCPTSPYICLLHQQLLQT